jgi:hypothetical protein
MRNANGTFSSCSAAAAKLDPSKVKEIRSLHRAGFSAHTIAYSYDVTPRCVRDIIKGRSWSFVADDPEQLPPLLPLPVVSKLKLRTPKRLSAVQQKMLDAYRQRLTAEIESAAEREGVAIRLLEGWRPRRASKVKGEFHKGMTGNMSWAR